MRTKLPSAKEMIRDLEADGDVLDNDRAAKERGRLHGDKQARAQPRTIEVGDNVLVKSMTPGTKWSPKYLQGVGKVLERNGGEVIVEMQSGKRLRRNVAHLLHVNDAVSLGKDQAPESDSDDEAIDPGLEEDTTEARADPYQVIDAAASVAEAQEASEMPRRDEQGQEESNSKYKLGGPRRHS